MSFLCSASFGQTLITIGNGTNTNTNTQYPAPYGNFYWGARHQIIILASELNAAGMTAGDINSLAFDVATPAGTMLVDFTIGLKNTTSTSVGANFEAGATTVYGPQNFTETTGWNTHAFGTPFYWDGTSNLLVETCFNNTAWSNNAQMYFTPSGFNSVGYFRQDAPNVCAAATTTTSQNRPNMRFDWNPGNVPPSADFTSNTTFTCSGIVTFTDQSIFNPTSWQWDFGDAGTSTAQNPTHTYTANGTYTVTLIACNAFGCDTTIFNNYITVNTGAAPPIAPSCTPVTTTYCCGFGITNVQFNTINNSSNDGADGYSDFTCSQTTVTEGQSYLLTIETPTPTTHNAAAWIDFNNDGILNDITERVMTSTSATTHTGMVSIPNGTVLNTPLRLRVSADYDFSTPPTSCSDSEFGQVEDYTVIIQANTSPPVADFSVSDTLTCDGTVTFTDLSANLPTSWSWDFGDANTSNQQIPTHTYTASGTYTVTLTATNAFGSDPVTYTNIITVNLSGALTPPACSPATLAYCCGYGIYNLTFSTIDFDSPDGGEGYQDNSCTVTTSVTEGTTVAVSVRTGQNSPQDTRIWIDYNNDGTLNNTNELVFTSLSDYNPAGIIAIPGGAVTNTPLRMRVSSDVVGGALTSCDDNSFGQTEDYAVTILQNTSPPNASFFTDSTVSCTGIVAFTDLTTNGPTQWDWTFGDGGTSTAQNPTHTYTVPGTYTVTLTATNANGSDLATYTNYVTYDPNACVIYTIPFSGTEVIPECNGTLYDSGGPTANYFSNTTGTTVIQPPGASQLTLTFQMFDFVASFGGDSLYIYDGPTIGSPLIGAYSGNGLPNGGTIITSTGAVTLRMITDGATTDPGFEMDWTCVIGGGNPPVADFTATQTTICDGDCINFTDLSTNSPNQWTWTFPGSSMGTSSTQDPTNVCYFTPGTYDVTLSVSNGFGTSDTTFIDYITVNSCPPPTANFSVSTTQVCETLCVDFTDMSTGSPTLYSWNFPGGIPSSSSAANPSVCYSTAGTYDVTLTVTNPNGSDDTTAIDLMVVVPCDTVFVPSAAPETECQGWVMDDGGPSNYSDNVDGTVTIAPAGSVLSVTLNFTEFDFDLSDTLYIYDGPDQNSPLIGAYTGPFLPNGGMVTSTGSSITLRQVTDGSTNSDGFTASWDCQPDAIDDQLSYTGTLDIYPNPATDQLTINFESDTQNDRIVVSMVNALGQTVYFEQLNQQDRFVRQVDVSNLPAGLYFITVQTPQGQSVRKAVIE